MTDRRTLLDPIDAALLAALREVHARRAEVRAERRRTIRIVEPERRGGQAA